MAITVDAGICTGANATAYNTSRSTTDFPVGSDDSATPPLYYVCTLAQLNALRDIYSATTATRVVLRNNIDGANADFTPIGTQWSASTYPNGTAASAANRDEFDGNSLTISNLAIRPGNTSYLGGLFATIRGHAYVHHLKLKGFTLSSNFTGNDGSHGFAFGFLAAKAAESAVIQHITVEDSTLTASFTHLTHSSRGGVLGHLGDSFAGDTGACTTDQRLTHITVRNVTINNPEMGRVGGIVGWFRGNNANCSASNLSAENVNLTAKAGVGGAIGRIETGSSLSNLTVRNVNITVTAAAADGIGGAIGPSANSTVSDASATGSITLTDTTRQAGGFVSYISGGTWARVYSTVSVTGGYEFLGGFAEEVRPDVTSISISDSYASGALSASSSAGAGTAVGGFAGRMELTNANVSLSRVFARGNVTVNNTSINHSGGFIGSIAQSTGGRTLSISQAYYSGTLTSTSTVRNGFAGNFLSGNQGDYTVSSSYFNADVNPTTDRGTGLTAVEMETQASYVGFTFGPTSDWIWDSNADLPMIRVLSN
jgi:hypothetical protein